MFPRCYSTNCSQIWKPEVGAGADEKGIEARRERHWLVLVLRLSYLNAKLASKGYLILHFKIVTWCVDCYFVDLNQTQIPRCEGHIPKTNLFVFNWSYLFLRKNNKLYIFSAQDGLPVWSVILQRVLTPTHSELLTALCGIFFCSICSLSSRSIAQCVYIIIFIFHI